MGRLLSLAAVAVALLALTATAAGAAEPQRVERFGEPGTGVGGLEKPGGIAVGGDGSRLFVADADNNRIDEYTAGGHFVRAWGWGVLNGTSKLQTCFGPTEEELENGEGEGKKCRRGQAGQGAGQLNEPIGVAVDAAGNVYAVNAAEGDGRILRFAVAGPNVTALKPLPAGYGKETASKAGLTYPLPPTNDVAIGGDGSVYVADNGEGGARVLRFDPEAGTFTTIPVALGAITAIAADRGAERLYVADELGNVVVFGAGEEEIEAYESPATYGITAIAVDPDSGNLLLEPENVQTIEGRSSIELIETSPEGARLRSITVGGAVAPEYPEPNPFGLAIDPEAQFPDSEPGAIYVADRLGGHVDALAEPTPGAPIVEEVSATQVGIDGANLTASVDPKGNDTHVYFEYGTSAAYGTAVPLPPGIDLGAGFDLQRTAVHLGGLAPGTTYHYAAVATNAAGTVTTAEADRTFTTFAPAGPFALPDGRAWEQVTTEKGNNSVESSFAGGATADGDGIAFGALNGLPGSPSGALISSYAAFREPSGWRTVPVSPPDNAATIGPTKLFSPDLSESLSAVENGGLGPAPAGPNLWIRDTASGAETLITPYPKDPGVFGLTPVGASTDFSRIFIESTAALTPDTPKTNNNSLYEYGPAGLRNVGILPGAASPTAHAITPGAVQTSINPVSDDGSRVFFVTQPDPQSEGEEVGNQVFARIDDDRTVEISASQATVPDPEAAKQNAAFVGASADGQVAFFKSGARLTDDANVGTGTERPANLYRYDLRTGALVDISVSTDPADEERGAAVANAITSDDGDVAYFVAEGALAPGGQTGEPNLYRWSAGGGTRFLGVVSRSDSFFSFFESPATTARTTTDGSVFVFTSQAALDPAFPDTGDTNQIYRYAAAANSIECVSCARAGGSQSPAQIGLGSLLKSNVLSADGSRVFFDTEAALVPEDTNDRVDVYEWEGGAARLISSGTGRLDSNFLDASASGDDVFFVTHSRLVAGDTDENADVYDARVNGGLPGPGGSPVPCEAGGCRPSSEGAPSEPAIGSRSLVGPPNRKHRHHRKKHRRHRHHRKHGGKSHGKHKRSHAHPATGKRG